MPRANEGVSIDDRNEDTRDLKRTSRRQKLAPAVLSRPASSPARSQPTPPISPRVARRCSFATTRCGAPASTSAGRTSK